MKNRITIIILVIIAVAVIVGVGIYFVQKNKTSIDSVENTISPNQTENSNQNNVAQQNKIVTDEFEISLPDGWQKTAPVMGTSAMAVKMNEQLNDIAAQKINFNSYYAVSYDVLQGKSLEGYLQNVKNQLQQTIPGIIFAQENGVVINDKPARAFEASFAQRGVNFKILMVAVKGDGDDVWVMSFNTPQSMWTKYQETFSDVANSFNIKKQ